jgi:hypothetical protein
MTTFKLMFKLKNLTRISNIIFILIGFVFVGCSSSQQVTSSQNNGEIKIDGQQSDWKQLTNIKGENISFGFSNDANNLYVSMITNNRSKIMNILRGGLEVWIDPGNSNDKIGIRYPEKPDPAEMMEEMRKQGPPDFNKTPKEINENKELDPMMKNFLEKQKELYVLDDDGKIIKSYPIDSKDYKVSLRVDKSSLCYELKIPIGKKPFLNYSNNKNDSKVRVEFQSGEIEMDMQRPDGMGGDGMRPSGPPPGGGTPPPGGGPGGFGGQGMNQSNFKNTGQIDYSFDVLINK